LNVFDTLPIWQSGVNFLKLIPRAAPPHNFPTFSHNFQIFSKTPKTSPREEPGLFFGYA
jgi:hypothetical protein